MSDNRCPKCGSEDVIPNTHVSGEFHDRKLKVDIVENLEAWVFKGVHESILTSAVCGQCGFVELYAKNPSELLKAYRQKQRPVK
jgi:predicted nucleic-acid-binding Zn-ribbon protein